MYSAWAFDQILRMSFTPFPFFFFFSFFFSFMMVCLKYYRHGRTEWSWCNSTAGQVTYYSSPSLPVSCVNLNALGFYEANGTSSVWSVLIIGLTTRIHFTNNYIY
jgi:hypothetical protein